MKDQVRRGEDAPLFPRLQPPRNPAAHFCEEDAIFSIYSFSAPFRRPPPENSVVRLFLSGIRPSAKPQALTPARPDRLCGKTPSPWENFFSRTASFGRSLSRTLVLSRHCPFSEKLRAVIASPLSIRPARHRFSDTLPRADPCLPPFPLARLVFRQPRCRRTSLPSLGVTAPGLLSPGLADTATTSLSPPVCLCSAQAKRN